MEILNGDSVDRLYYRFTYHKSWNIPGLVTKSVVLLSVEDEGCAIVCERLVEKKSVIANFINAKLRSEAIVIDGDGNQTRDFIHVNEVCKAIERCLPLYGIEVDIGTGKERSINQVANMLGCT